MLSWLGKCSKGRLTGPCQRDVLKPGDDPNEIKRDGHENVRETGFAQAPVTRMAEIGDVDRLTEGGFNPSSVVISGV